MAQAALYLVQSELPDSNDVPASVSGFRINGHSTRIVKLKDGDIDVQVEVKFKGSGVYDLKVRCFLFISLQKLTNTLF